jgi:hypothetical protein
MMELSVLSLNPLQTKNPVVEELQGQGIRAEYDAWNSHLNSELKRFAESDETVKATELSLMVAKAILQPSGEMNLDTLHRIQQELTGGDAIESSIAEMLDQIASSQGFFDHLSQVCSSGGDKERAVVNISLHRPLSHPISDGELRCVLLAHFLVPVQGSGSAEKAWQARGCCAEQILDDFVSLLRNDYVERPIQGQQCLFWGQESEAFLEAVYASESGPGLETPPIVSAPLVDQWMYAVNTMRFLPSSLIVNRTDSRIKFFKDILAAFCDAAVSLKREDVAKLYRDDFFKLATVCDQGGDHIIIQKEGIQSLNTCALYGTSRYWPSLCIGGTICSTVSEFVESAKKVFLDACGAVDQLAWKGRSGETQSVEDQLSLALSKVYTSLSPGDLLGVQDLIVPIALGQLAQGEVVTNSLPNDLHHVSMLARWIRTKTPSTRIPSNMGLLLPREPSLMEGTDRLDEGRKTLCRALDKDPRYSSEHILRPFQDELFKVWNQQKSKFYHVIAAFVRISCFPGSFQQKILDSVQAVQEYCNMLFTDEEMSKLQISLLNYCYRYFPQDTAASLVKYGETFEGALYYWSSLLGGECSVVRSRETSSFIASKTKDISWQTRLNSQLSEEIQKEQKTIRELMEKGFEGPAIMASASQPFPDPRQVRDVEKVLPPPFVLSPALREAALRRCIGDADSPLELVESVFRNQVAEKMAAWKVQAGLLEEYGMNPAVVRTHSFPYLVAEALLLPDGTYNLNLIDDVIRELLPPPEARDDADIEIVRNLYRLQQQPSLQTALEQIPVPTLRTPSTVIRRGLGLPDSYPITVHDVRLVCLASYLTCMRQESVPDCSLFSVTSTMKDKDPEEMLSHWRELMSTGAIQGKRVNCPGDEAIEQFRWIESCSCVSEEEIPQLVEVPMIKKFLAKKGMDSETLQGALVQRIRTAGSLTMNEMLNLAGAPEEFIRKMRSCVNSPLLEMWKFTLGSAVFPPYVLGSIFFSDPVQQAWALRVLARCNAEAERRGLQKLSEKLFATVQTLERTAMIHDPDFQCLNVIRHSLLYKDGGLCWSPYMERDGDFQMIDANNTQAFEQVFVRLCQAVYGSEAKSLLAQDRTPFPAYAEVCERKGEGNKADVTLPATQGECQSIIIQDLCAHYLTQNFSYSFLEKTLTLSEGEVLPRILRAITSGDSGRPWVARASTGTISGHAFRILPTADLSDERIESTKQKTLMLWNTTIRPTSHVTMDAVRIMKEMVVTRFQNRGDILQALDKAVEDQLASKTSTTLRTGLLRILNRVESVAGRRFNDRERQCVELAAFRGMSLDHPEELAATSIPFGDSNWMGEKTARVLKGLYSFHFSPLSHSWRIALIDGGTVVSDRYKGRPVKEIVLRHL